MRVELEAEFRGDHDAVANRPERFAYELFVRERAIDLGGIEERDATIDGCAQQRDAVLFVDRRAVAKAQTHAAEADGGNFEAALTERAFLHVELSAQRRRDLPGLS